MDSPGAETLPEVFVTVPSYNHAPYVERCLRSIIGQTLPPKKLLVIDDGSKDNSVSVIENVLKDCPFACDLIARDNRGLCATLNEALSQAKDDYFAYLGSDDLWLPRFLEEQTVLLRSRPNAVLAFAHAFVIDEQDRIVASTDEWNDFAGGDARSMLLNGVIFSSPGVVYRRSALEGVRWNESAKLEDYEMYLRLSTIGDFARNEKILCAWRRHGVNASGDLPMIYTEMIAAQDRLAPVLGLTRADLARVQTRLRFNATENLVRHGFRQRAAEWYLANLGGAPSIGDAARIAFRLAVPQSIFQWNRRRKLGHAAERRGVLDLNK
jgi:alpha-1,3-rhamnosyltransferase